jgi:hypothetical protein
MISVAACTQPIVSTVVFITYTIHCLADRVKPLIVAVASLRYTNYMTKQTAKKATKHSNKKVDYEPNKMTFAIAALAAVTLVLLAVIVTFS